MISMAPTPHLPRPARVSAYVAARLGPPVIDPATLGEVVARYGLRAIRSPRNLRLGRRSTNVSLATDRGRKVVKLYRPHWSDAAVRYAHSILLRLEEVGFPAPRLVHTRDGATYAGTADGMFAIFNFIPGINYSLNFLMRRDRLRLTALAGRTLAHLHRALDGFVPDGDHHLGFLSPTGPRRRDVAWHAAMVEELKDRSSALPTGDAKDLARRLIDRSTEVLDAIERLELQLRDVPFPRVIVHGDYGLHNLLYQRGGRAVPVDFELSRLDWRLNDLISALVKFRYSGGLYDFESMEVLIGAYAAESPLTPDERRLLPTAWRCYKLQAAVQYWNSYFQTDGPTRKLASALDSIDQADWVMHDPEVARRLARVARDSSSRASDGRGPRRGPVGRAGRS